MIKVKNSVEIKLGIDKVGVRETEDICRYYEDINNMSNMSEKRDSMHKD